MRDATKQLHLDIEENGVRLHLTVVDTPGFGDFVNNDDRYVKNLAKLRSSHLYVILAGGQL